MSLNDIFSSTAQSKFERLVKPIEFEQKRKSLPTENENLHPKRKRKADHEKAKSADVTSKEEEPSNDSEDKSKKTVFAGNLATSMSVKDIKKLFSQYGEVDSVRLRSVPIAGTAVDEAGNQDLVKKVCSIKKNLGTQKGSMNAYIVFKEEESVHKALEANNTFLNNRHLRVDFVVPSILEPKRTVFIGSLHHYVDEEDLRNHFAAALPNAQDEIECVRVIRDPDTLVGKGIAFVSFKSSNSVLQALSLNKKVFKKRELRVTTCSNSKVPKRDANGKSSINQNTAFMMNKQKRKVTEIETKRSNEKKPSPSFTPSSSSSSSTAPKVKKPRHIPRTGSATTASTATASHVSATILKPPVVHKINLKSVMTKTKVLVSRGQKQGKGQKAKAKEISGSVKRAIKAAKTNKANSK